MMHLLAVFFLSHWFHFLFWGSPWYTGAIWGNIFVVFVAAPLGYLWSKTKFWPLKYLERSHQELHQKIEDLHKKHDAHTRLQEAHTEEIKRLMGKIDELHRKLGP